MQHTYLIWKVESALLKYERAHEKRKPCAGNVIINIES